MSDIVAPESITLPIKPSKFERYKKSLGEPPKELMLFRDPKNFWGFQQDILKLSKSAISPYEVLKIHRALNQNQIYVVNNATPYLTRSGSAEECETINSSLLKGHGYRLFLGSNK